MNMINTPSMYCQWETSTDHNCAWFYFITFFSYLHSFSFQCFISFCQLNRITQHRYGKALADSECRWNWFSHRNVAVYNKIKKLWTVTVLGPLMSDLIVGSCYKILIELFIVFNGPILTQGVIPGTNWCIYTGSILVYLNSVFNCTQGPFIWTVDIGLTYSNLALNL